MQSLRFFRLLSLAAVVATAGAAQAFSIDILSHGHYALASGSFTSAEAVVYQDTNAIKPVFTTLNYSITNATLAGTGTYSNGVDSLTFAVQFTTDIPTDGFSSTQNAHGFWTYTSGTGAFANLSGSGVFAANYNAPLGATSLGEFSGMLIETTPEPTTYAALGLGLAVVLRRRKNS